MGAQSPKILFFLITLIKSSDIKGLIYQEKKSQSEVYGQRNLILLVLKIRSLPVLFLIRWSKPKVTFLQENHTLKNCDSEISRSRELYLWRSLVLYSIFINLCLKRMNEKSTAKSRLSSGISHNCENNAFDCSYFITTHHQNSVNEHVRHQVH